MVDGWGASARELKMVGQGWRGRSAWVDVVVGMGGGMCGNGWWWWVVVPFFGALRCRVLVVVGVSGLGFRGG